MASKSRVIPVLLATLVGLLGSTLPGTGARGGGIPGSPSPQSTPMAEFYVSPGGSDSGAGTLADPFRTLSRARDAARALPSPMTGDVVVYLRGGTYYLDDTVTFNQSDSGTGGFTVTYRNYPGETPVLSGGRPVTGWSEVAGGGGVWSAPSPVSDFRQLYVDGERATRARGAADFVLSTTGDGHAVAKNSIQNWKNLQDVEFVYKDIWTLPRVHPAYIKDDFVYMQQPAYSFLRTKSDSQNEAPVWVENARELLDEPGEWYLDRGAGVVYYMPRPGEDLDSVGVVAPAVEVLLSVEGNSSDKVHDLEFRGISFEHGSWLQPNEFGTNCVAVQANVIRTPGPGRWDSEMSPANVVVRNATGIAFRSCNFTHLGTAGIHLRGGVQHSTIVGCKFSDVSGTGIQVGEVSATGDPASNATVKGLSVLNNYVTNCCVEYMSGVGIFGGYVRETRIEHNTISNLPYTGISLGWGWSAKETEMADNSVKYNAIYGVMTYLKDGGGIYTLSTQPGTNVSYNAIHDSGWNGLYPDERTNGTTWSHNVVWDTHNSFLDHSMYEEAKWNDITDNYLETYPLYSWVWYAERDGDQVWGLRPGDPGFPQDIVDAAGVEPQYAYLVPGDEWYWNYERYSSPSLVGTHPVASLAVLAGVVAFGVAGTYYIGWRGPVARRVPRPDPAGSDGGGANDQDGGAGDLDAANGTTPKVGGGDPRGG
ncbi:MAG: right-handed parallel beta-helix repeat-containing protein [Promethearchaeota archaeon]